MAALVGTDGNALRVFLQGSGYHLFHTAVVPEVNDLGAHAHQDAAHDVDGSVVPVEQAGCRHETHFVQWSVIGKHLELVGKIGHVVTPGSLHRRTGIRTDFADLTLT